MTNLTHQETIEGLKKIPDWTHQAKNLTRTFKFETFLLGIAFVRRIAKRAEKLQHHPDIDVRFDQVKLTNTTHDAGGLTAKDFQLAEQCDEVFAKFAEE
jgi:4a-hydroxytetrahydrobiopterin dehydratase